MLSAAAQCTRTLHDTGIQHIVRDSFIQLNQQGLQWSERKCPIFETVAKGGSNPGSLDCESGILSLSYRAPPRGPSKCYVT